MKKAIFVQMFIPILLAACGGSGHHHAPQDSQMMQPPASQQPLPQKPDTQKPDTQKPDTQKPDTQKPDTQKPDTQKPDTQKPDTQKPDMKKPDMKKPDMKKPDMKKPPLPPLPQAPIVIPSAPQFADNFVGRGLAILHFQDKETNSANAEEQNFRVIANQQSNHYVLTLDAGNEHASQLANNLQYIVPLNPAGSVQTRNIITYRKPGEESFVDKSALPEYQGYRRTYEVFMTSSKRYSFTQFGGFDFDEGVGVFARGGFSVASTIDKLKGQATYQGDAVVAHYDKPKGQRLESGISSLDVDFDKKEARLKLRSDNYALDDVVLSIHESELEKPGVADGIRVRGGFTGGAGEEAYGVIEDERSRVNAAFGAKRQ